MGWLVRGALAQLRGNNAAAKCTLQPSDVCCLLQPTCMT